MNVQNSIDLKKDLLINTNKKLNIQKQISNPEPMSRSKYNSHILYDKYIDEDIDYLIDEDDSSESNFSKIDSSENILDSSGNILDSSGNILDSSRNILLSSENILNSSRNILLSSENILSPENILDKKNNQ